MASLKTICTMAALFVTLMATLVSPGTGNYLKRESAEFLLQCKKKMGLDCGNKINIKLFGRGTPYPNSCCGKLVEMGKRCHDGVVTKHLLGKPRDYIVKVLVKSEWIWNHCVRVVRYWKRHGPRYIRT